MSSPSDPPVQLADQVTSSHPQPAVFTDSGFFYGSAFDLVLTGPNFSRRVEQAKLLINGEKGQA